MHILKLEKCDTKSLTVHSGGENPDEGCVVEIMGVLLTISIQEKDRCFFQKIYFIKIKKSSVQQNKRKHKFRLFEILQKTNVEK